mmetsp:Transcript_8802/g.27063  ORF Transcript_8802/g.27063 Transcript_8802/m.27063 type:complete len:239 (-) Transcript_8802:1456-2172(-)
MLQPVSSRDNASLEEPSHPVSMPQVHTTPSKPHLRSACEYFETGNEAKEWVRADAMQSVFADVEQTDVQFTGVEMEKRTEEQRAHSKDELEKFQAATNVLDCLVAGVLAPQPDADNFQAAVTINAFLQLSQANSSQQFRRSALRLSYGKTGFGQFSLRLIVKPTHVQIALGHTRLRTYHQTRTPITLTLIVRVIWMWTLLKLRRRSLVLTKHPQSKLLSVKVLKTSNWMVLHITSAKT